jgi:hemicentin
MLTTQMQNMSVKMNATASLLLLVFVSLFVASTATITFSQVPQDVLVAIGTQVEFTCQFTSTNAANVQWFKDGVSVTSSSRISITQTSMTINPTQSGDDGQYSCVVTDQLLGISETRNATLTFAYIYDSFLINPESQSVPAGTSVFFFCLHSGSLPAAAMIWLKDGTIVNETDTITITIAMLQHTNPPQTSSSISISPTAVADSGTYKCMATNPLLTDAPVTSSTGTLTVTPQLVAPVFVAHPLSTVIPAAGVSVDLNCSFTGEPSPTVTWQFNGVNVGNPLLSFITTNGGNSFLTIPTFQQSNVGNYRCAATNSQGTTYSNNANVQIAFIQQSFELSPQNATVIVGDDAVIDCVPPLSAPPATVSWFRDSSLLTGDQFNVLTNGSLLISSVNLNNDGDYLCTATNQLLDITRTSSLVHLTVYDIPSIVNPLSDIQMAQYGNLTLSCNATGVPIPTIKWYKDNVLVVPSNAVVFTGFQLTIYNISLNDEGNYSCAVTNQAGSDQSAANIDIIPFPIVLMSSLAIDIQVSYPVVLPCNILQDESISVSWALNGNQLTLPFPGYQLFPNNSLLIQSVALTQGGTYTCTGTNTLGSVGASVQLNVLFAPSVNAVQDSLSYTQGQIAQLQCTVSGNPTPSVTWTKDGVAISNDAILSHNGTILTFNPVVKANEGNYTCTATNSLGEDSDIIILRVLLAPSVSVTPLTQTVLVGTTVEFTCSAPGDPLPAISWLTSNLVNVLLLNNERIQVLSDNTLRISNTTGEDGDQYVCQASNNVGTSTASVNLIIHEIPSVSLLPQLNVTQGAHVVLDCKPRGLPTPSLTWYKDDTSLMADGRVTITNGTINITNTVVSDAGLYQCVAENIVGNATASIDLVVLSLPLILVPNPIVSVNEGSNAYIHCIATGVPTPTVTWYFGSVLLPNPTLPRYSVNSNNTLIVSDITLDDEGLTFLCRAINPAGTESATIRITVNSKSFSKNIVQCILSCFRPSQYYCYSVSNYYS